MVISEEIHDRIQMVDKRNAKLPDMLKEMNSPEAYYQDSEILLVGWGSTKGAIHEAVDLLRGQGYDVGALHFVDLWPFPGKAMATVIDKAQKIFMVELNGYAQLGLLIRQQTGLNYSGALLKYDGRPFYPYEIIEGIKKQMR